jgi:ATP-dependent Clp protease adaptor protein ClpS
MKIIIQLPHFQQVHLSSIETEEDLVLDVEVKEENQLVVFNDDINTFEHVIASLIKVCGHSLIQADQCAHIIHYNGKCAVMTGDYADLIAPRFALTDRGLLAEIL